MERRDIFISYTKKDTEQAVWIADVLKSHGYTVYIQQLDIKPGDNFLEKMNEFLKNSDNFLAVWSEAYSKSRFCMTEMQAAFNEWHKRRINGFLPVCIENYPMEPLYAAMVHADLFGMNKASAEEVLIDAVHSLVSRTETESDTPVKPEHTKNKNSNASRRFVVKFIILLITIAFLWVCSLVSREPVMDLYRVLNNEPVTDEPELSDGETVTDKPELSDEELYQTGYNYYSVKNYTQAQEYYELAAKKGNVNALYGLGLLYHHARNYTKAREYYEQAAEKGNELALYNLGLFYESGCGVDVDYHKAIDYYQQAAAKGYENAATRAEELRAKLDE